MSKTTLADIPKDSKLKLDITDGKNSSVQMCTFNHLDGMYSHITTEKGDVVHLAAFAPLKKVKDYYELAEVSYEK